MPVYLRENNGHLVAHSDRARKRISSALFNFGAFLTTWALHRPPREFPLENRPCPRGVKERDLGGDERVGLLTPRSRNPGGDPWNGTE